jgi:2-polyprenyl-3-methyl-5-hydroxy-6-metoxy-1,4-benzoquinol methylase
MPTVHHDTSLYDLELQMDSPRDPRALEIRMIGTGKRVLELGSAGGITTKAMVERGCQVVAVELDPIAAERAGAHAERVVVGDLDDPETLRQVADDRFDVVLAGDVLEHLRDPLAVVLAAREVLEPDGFLVVSIPNVAHADVRLSLLGGRFPYSDTGLLDQSHLRFFTLESFEALLAQAGFVIADLERLRAAIFTTELDVDQASVDPELVKQLLEDPEAETYQFVLRAVVRFTDDAREALARRNAVLARELAEAEAANRQLRADLAQTKASLAEGEDALADFAARLTSADLRSDELQDEVRALREHVFALQNTKLYRVASPFRRVYGSMRPTPPPAP